MPTNEKKTVLVNGKEEKPIKKTKLPLDVDWQAIAKRKQAEAAEKAAAEKAKKAKEK